MKCAVFAGSLFCGVLMGRADVAVLTQHNDLSRTGANLQENVLNVTNVNPHQFGLLWTRPVDDQIYAQPLIMTNVEIAGGGTHNLLLVVTASDSVYAFDADDPSVTVAYWRTNLLGPGVVPPRNTDMTGACSSNYQDFTGNIGIVSTPVIDAATGTIYLLARTKEVSEGTTNFVQRLHALDVATGAERSNSPAVIEATYPGTGDGSVAGLLAFDPQRENQRAGLTLVNGIVYLAWASHCDWGPYHGWVMGYDARTLQPVAVWNDTPNGSGGGIWMSGAAPAADTDGNIYLSVGNGTMSATDHGESLLKLAPAGGSMSVASSFTPYDWLVLNYYDLDLGAAGVLLIPGTTLALSGGKQGVLYLVNRDQMGGFASGADTNIVQSWTVATNGDIHGAPVWWSGADGAFAYVWPQSSNQLCQYLFTNGQFATAPFAEGPTVGGPGSPGGVLSISADGADPGTGIVWATVNTSAGANQATVPGTLHAYSARHVSTELWNSDMVPGRDSLGNLAKFVPPTIANGRVYVATFSNRLNVYGLLPAMYLSITNSGGGIVLSWPTNSASGCVLQVSTNLLSGLWSAVTNPAVASNGVFQVSFTAPGDSASFYRLAR
jgi:hypothetical protein